MKKIGLVINESKDNELEVSLNVIRSILANGAIPVLSDSLKEKMINKSKVDSNKLCWCSNILEQADIVLCIGGDGTFLKAARDIYNTNIAILGINLGSLGFLTEVEKSEIDVAVQRLVLNEYDIEHRMMIQAQIFRDGKIIAEDFSLNDIVISRGALSRIIHLNVYTNDSILDSIPGDGLIISTPTGSTAYSLSAGGPIVEPDIDLIIITPICAHSLYSRSFITSGDREVKVIIDENYNHKAMVTIDGQKGYEVRGGDVVVSNKSEYTVKLIKIKKTNFFEVLRRKIYDRGEGLRK